MNLIDAQWISVRLQSGKIAKIAPWEITQTGDLVVSLDFSRPDFDASVMQFLIGLLQTTFMPDNEEEWKKRLSSPPNPEELKEKFSQYGKEVFDVKRFTQEECLEGGETLPISRLFIGCPGKETCKNDTDHFVKRNEIEKICSHCAVVALWTLQTNAPAGGRGHRTSIRGGGPLSTLVVMDESVPSELVPNIFWNNLWLNVLEKNNGDGRNLLGSSDNDLGDIFPWMGEIKTSNNEEKTTSEDVHPLQVYWGMPRRIRICWDMVISGVCDICLHASNQLVQKFVTKAYGVNYTGYWFHPISPIAIKEKTGERFNQKVKGKIVYINWPDLVLSEINAAVVRRYLGITLENEVQFRLHAFGYEMDKNKALRWVESKLPLLQVNNSEEIEGYIRNLVEASIEAEKKLNKAIREVKNKEERIDKKSEKKEKRRKEKGKKHLVLKDNFFDRTQGDFFKHIISLPRADVEKRNSIKQEWGQSLKETALNLFDLSMPLGKNFLYDNMDKIARAKKGLRIALNRIVSGR